MFSRRKVSISIANNKLVWGKIKETFLKLMQKIQKVYKGGSMGVAAIC